MPTLHIATACFLNVQQQLLVVRKQRTTAWMLPGGKLDGAETPEQALLREVQEELQLQLQPCQLARLGYFEATAANEPDTRVQAHAFMAVLPEGQQPTISAEIAAMQWLPLNEALPDAVAPLLREHIIPALRAQQAMAVQGL